VRCSLGLALAACLGAPLPTAAGDLVSRAGDVGEIVLPAAALAATAFHHDGGGAQTLGKSFVSTIAVVYGLKYSIDRQRPDGGRHSFPSGHTASAAAGAAFLQRRYGWRYGIPAYAAAGFVGWSRIHANRHHASDVIAGAALGIGANLLMTQRRAAVSVAPVPGGVSVAIAW